MSRRKFALQPLLEQRMHRERVQAGELARAQRAHAAVERGFAAEERRYDAAAADLTRCATQGRVAEARLYDEILRSAGGLRLRWAAEMQAHDAEVLAATAALTTANRERRALERLRERLDIRRAPRRHDDD